MLESSHSHLRYVLSENVVFSKNNYSSHRKCTLIVILFIVVGSSTTLYILKGKI